MIKISELPSVPLRERSSLPDIPGVYFIIRELEVLYVGSTWRSVRVRMAHHQSVGKFALESGDLQVAWLLTDDPTKIRDIERSCISELNPTLNIQKGSRKRYVEPLEMVFGAVPARVAAAIRALAASEQRSVSQIVRRPASQRKVTKQTCLKHQRHPNSE